MRITSQILIILSTLSATVAPKLVSAANSARLGISAVVLTRCSIRVRTATDGQLKITSSCSDNTKPTILAKPGNSDESEKSRTSDDKKYSEGAADVTVNY